MMDTESQLPISWLQIQLPVARLDCIQVSSWLRGHMEIPPKSQADAKTIGCSPQTESREAPLTRSVPINVNEHEEVKVVPPCSCHPYIQVHSER